MCIIENQGVILDVLQFDKRLKLLREEGQLSQAELAKKICVSKSSINMYERGEREPKFEILEKIADYFNVDMNYLLGRSEIRNRYQQELIFLQAPSQDIYTDIEQQLGSDTRNAVSMYMQLDRDDRGEIRGEMKEMLKDDKYKTAPCSKGKGAEAS